MRSSLLLFAAALLASPVLLPAQDSEHAALQQQVMAAERAFAKTMADRDHAAFAALLSHEAIFYNGEEPIRGKDAVAAAWKPFYAGPDAWFSWDPDRVEVIESFTLALSTGSGPRLVGEGRRAVQLDLAAGAVRRVAGCVREGKPGLPSSAGAASLTSRLPGAHV